MEIYEHAEKRAPTALLQGLEDGLTAQSSKLSIVFAFQVAQSRILRELRELTNTLQVGLDAKR